MEAISQSQKKAAFAGQSKVDRMSAIRDNAEPWQQNPWVWLIIAIPTLTVVGCMLTIYLALSNPHVIVDNGAPSNPAHSSTDSGNR